MRKPLVIYTTQLLDGVLLKMQKHTLYIFEISRVQETQNLSWSMKISFNQSPNRIYLLEQ